MRTFSCFVLACVLALAGGHVAVADSGDGWVALFDGTSLQNWKASEAPGSFKVVDGAIACDGPRSHLFYTGPGAEPGFDHFELRAKVMTRKGANSGLYFHTAWQQADWPKQGFEVQINNTQPAHGDYLELKKTGSLYGIRNTYKALAKDDEWFRMHVKVQGPRVQVRVNDTLVVDYRQPDGDVPGMKTPLPRLGRGTFALQCHDPGSKVFFKDLQVRRLPAPTAAETGPAPVIDRLYAQRHDLARDNFPVLDLHVHLKGGLTLEEALRQSRESGIAFGIAVNAGKGFPIETDSGIEAFYKEMQGQPVFIAMQAEGREWVRMFSKEARARFDYVFTDGMTFTDHRGQRTRLWIKEEVEIDDEQKFMERLVSTIVGILETEPIDVYVNSTFLPAVLADKYDALWTDERMARVVAAALKSGVAIEINNRYRIPSERFLRKAKDAGVKLTCGTNNAANDLGDFSYCLEMQKALDLSWKHMWVPGHAPKRAERN